MTVALAPALRKKKWTVESYFAWTDPTDETRYELINGQLITMAAPELSHQRIAGNIYFALRVYATQHEVGETLIAPVDVVLGDNVVEPDILFISNERKVIAQRKRVVGAPDLVVEVLSTSTAKRDLRDKWELYAAHGVQEYWIVDPAGAVEILELVDGDYTTFCHALKDEAVRSKLLDGFEIDWHAVFDD